MSVLFLVLTCAFMSKLCAVPCAEDPTPPCSVCTKWEDVFQGDVICDDEVNTTSLECETAFAISKMCVEEKVYKKENMACTNVTVLLAGETCDIILNKYNLDIRHLKELNNDRNICENMSGKSRICTEGIYDCPHVKMEEDFPVCAVDPCKEAHIIRNHMETCETIASQYSVSVEQLIDNNQNFVCDEIFIGDSVCIWRPFQRKPRKNTHKCAVTVPVNSHTCEKLATRYSLSFAMFTENNLNFRCNELSSASTVCAGKGYFVEGTCTDYIITSDVYNSCDKLLKLVFNDNHAEMRTLNPLLDCSRLSLGTLVCVRNSERFLESDTQKGILRIVRELKTHSLAIARAYQIFLTNATAENKRNMEYAFMREISQTAVIGRLEAAYANNGYIKKIIDALTSHVDRKKACENFKKSGVFESLSQTYIADCFCEDDLLLLNCGALIFEAWELLKKQSKSYEAENKPRQATSPCFMGPTLRNKTKGGCVQPGCKVEYTLFSVFFDSVLCWPGQTSTLNKSVVCENPNDCFEKHSIATTVRICSYDKVLQFAFGGDTCLSVPALYNPLLGIIRVHTIFLSNFFKVEARLSFKVHQMHDAMLKERDCDSSGSRCEDFCVWRNEKDWTFYGFLSASLDFGLLKFPVFEHIVTFPYEDCAGNMAVVVVENQRTKNGNMTIRCWSSDEFDGYIMEETTILYQQKHRFAIKNFEETAVTCALKDRLVDDIALDVYGGINEDAPIGREVHTFRVNAKTIEYLPEDEKKEKKIVAIWN